MKKKLTYRQQQFLNQFLELYQEAGKPLHYVAVAKRMGRGKVTVYEMLRLLEERGYVKADYEFSPEQHGPGRPPVLFQPTEETQKLGYQAGEELEEINDWQVLSEQILDTIQNFGRSGYENLIESLLSRMPERRSPLIFLTELITTVLLLLATLSDIPGIKTILERLKRIGLPQEIGLNALSGISMVFSIVEQANRRAVSVLLSQIGKYEEFLAQMNEENQRRLSEFAREVAQTLTI